MRGLRTGSIAVLLALALAVAFPAAVHGQAVVVCNNQVTVQTAASTSAVAVTGVAGKIVYICSAVMTAVTAAGLASVIEGTGTTCGTGTLGIVGTGTLFHAVGANGVISVGGGHQIHQTMVAGDDVCLKAGAGATITLTLSYNQK